MKAGLAMAACFALTLPNIASAVPLLTPADLGESLSILEFCEVVTPNHRTQLHEKAKKSMNELSEDSIEIMKQTSDFKSFYASTTRLLHGIPKDEAIQFCIAVAK